jgi:putative restriction endonuclease
MRVQVKSKMARLKNPQLYEKVLLAIHESGWHVQLDKNPPTNKPFLFHVYQEHEYILLNVHIWNVSDGGNTRNPDERRIQIRPRSGEEELKYVAGAYNLILGWWDDGKVFVGLDFITHRNPGRSSSTQFTIQTLQQAYHDGFATYINQHGETVFAFQSDYFMDYVTNLRILHDFGSSAADFATLQRAVAVPEQPDEVVSTTERQITMAIVKRRIRDATFRKRVLTAYGNRCAFCGLQLNLVEAAHILPVSIDNATDATNNGVALCVLHHKAYDNSFVTFDENYQIMINETQLREFRRINLDGGSDNFIKNLRKLVDLPPDKRDRPNPDFITMANEIRGW